MTSAVHIPSASHASQTPENGAYPYIYSNASQIYASHTLSTTHNTTTTPPDNQPRTLSVLDCMRYLAALQLGQSASTAAQDTARKTKCALQSTPPG